MDGELRPISEAPKDGTVILAKFRDDIYPVLRPHREDLEPWNGALAMLRHPGIYVEDGRTWDHGWNVALPVGSGGFPDEWIEGWLPADALTAAQAEIASLLELLAGVDEPALDAAWEALDGPTEGGVIEWIDRGNLALAIAKYLTAIRAAKEKTT